MTDHGKANYEGYYAAMPGAKPVPFEEVPYAERLRWDAGACSVEALVLGLLDAEDEAEGEPEAPPVRYARVEQMGHRSTVGTVREVTFCGKAMMELTALPGGTVHLVSPESLYEITWLTEEQARARTAPWTATAITAGDDEDDDEDDGWREAGDDSPGSDL